MGVPAVPQQVEDRYLPDGYISNAMSAGYIIAFGAACGVAPIGVKMQVVRLPATGAGWRPE